MSAYVVWLDSDNAKIISFEQDGEHAKAVHRHEVQHHTSGDQTNHKNPEKFYHEIAGKLSTATQILLVGPGLAKDHFKTHLEKHHHAELAKKIVGAIAIDPHHTSEAQILKKAHDFFREYDIYNAPIR